MSIDEKRVLFLFQTSDLWDEKSAWSVNGHYRGEGFELRSKGS
jgi:hypothetical protein